MVFDTSSPPASLSSSDRALSLDRMLKSTDSSLIEPPLSDERDLSQIEAAQKQQPSKWKMMSKRRQSCTNDMYATASRYHRLKLPTTPSNLSASDEPPPSTSPIGSTAEKGSSDDTKCVSTPSASVTTRRSTTDCNNLFAISRSSQPAGDQTNQTLLTIVDEESQDSIWPSSSMYERRAEHARLSLLLVEYLRDSNYPDER